MKNGTLLQAACEKGYTEIAQLMIDKGADVNQCDKVNISH